MWRPVIAIWLHDQRVLIAYDHFSVGTDSEATLKESPEYPLSFRANQALTDVLKAIGLPTTLLDESSIGVSRHYHAYPQDVELEALDVNLAGRYLEIRMKVQPKEKGRDGWTEQWTYQGHFTIAWPIETASE